MGFNGQAPPVGVLCWWPSNFIHVVCFAFIYGSRLELDIYQTKQQRIVIMCHSCFALNFKDVFSSKAELCRCVLCLEVTVFWEGRSTCSTISSKLFKKQTKLNSSVHKYSGSVTSFTSSGLLSFTVEDNSLCLCFCSVLVTVRMSFLPRPLDPLGCSSVQEQRDLWQRKFCRIAKEMVQTEQRYCQKLELVTTVCTTAYLTYSWS